MRKLAEIALDIKQNWNNPSYAAVPYIHVMSKLITVSASYGADSGKDIVIRFLANAQGWRGEKAREIKQELRSML